MTYEQWLHDMRVTANLTQTQVAHHLGIAGVYISEIERGTRHIPVKYLDKIIALYKAPREEFIEKYLEHRTEKYKKIIIKEINAWKA